MSLRYSTVFAALFAIGFVFIEAALCQAVSAPPSFETAAIHLVSHPSPNEDHSQVNLADARRFRAINADVSELIEWAYEVRTDRISGPADLKSKTLTFDIDAVVPEHADVAQARLMLRHLLAERFGVALHSVIKPTSGYLLVVDRGGPKLKASNKPDGGGMTAYGRTATIRLLSPSVKMESLASALSRNIEAPVMDQTHLDSLYDIDILFARVGPVESDAPTVFDVLKKSGLRLDKIEVPIESIVVDHANFKPTEN